MSLPTSLSLDQTSNTISNPLSPTSNVSDNNTGPQTPQQTTSFFSHPSSPHSSVSSIASFRPSYTNLPRLHIPHDPKKMVAQTRGTKRKLETTQELRPRSFESIPNPLQKSVAVQVNHPADRSILEAAVVYHEQNARLHQEMAEIKEGQLEWKAEMEALIERNIELTTRILRFEELVRELNIPKDKWP